MVGLSPAPGQAGCDEWCEPQQEVVFCSSRIPACAQCDFCLDQKLPCASWCTVDLCDRLECKGCRAIGCTAFNPPPALLPAPLTPVAIAASPPPPQLLSALLTVPHSPQPPAVVCWWCDPPPPPPSPLPRPPPPHPPPPLPSHPPLAPPPTERDVVLGLRLADPLIVVGVAAVVILIGVRYKRVLDRLRAGVGRADVEMGVDPDEGSTLNPEVPLARKATGRAAGRAGTEALATRERQTRKPPRRGAQSRLRFEEEEEEVRMCVKIASCTLNGGAYTRLNTPHLARGHIYTYIHIYI